MYSLKEIQNFQLEILKDVTHLCEKHDIKYFAIGGTALGAIRHEGFIPWDDDIDIAMLKPDFEKFMLVANQLPDNLFVLNHQTDNNYPLTFTKIMNKNIELIDHNHLDINYPHKVFIDIFEWLPFPEQDKIASTLNQANKIYTKFKRKIVKKDPGLIRKIKSSIYKFLYKKSTNYYLNQINNLFTVSSSNNVWGSPLHKGTLTYNEIFPVKSVKFENIQINIPNDTHKHLTDLYGDYLKLPPIEKRKPAHIV